MSSNLKEDLEEFLSLYQLFDIKESKNSSYINIAGPLQVVDLNGVFLEEYEVTFTFKKELFPHVIPTVIETSNKIPRHWDNHISPEGECCLSIPHHLIKMKRHGITLKEFYREVIYPFFANYQYKVLHGTYANGEYEHFESGIAQFYRETFSLIDYHHIIDLLKAALGNYQFPPNDTCPFCGNPKYKKCCRKVIYSLLTYGEQRLKIDLQIFNKLGAKESLPQVFHLK